MPKSSARVTGHLCYTVRQDTLSVSHVWRWIGTTRTERVSRTNL